MILAIDVGNTNIVFGCCDEGRIVFSDRFSTNQTAAALEYAVIFSESLRLCGIDRAEINGAVISSVVPSVTDAVKTAVRRFTGCEPMVVGPGIKTGLSILIDNPAQLGSDLVVDAVAGINNYPLPLIIIDMGTATTLSVIDRKGNYIGGMIVPGVAVSHDSLISRTSQLPKIALEPPRRVIGRNTVECLKSGILYGSAGAIDSLIQRINESLSDTCSVVATGGLAKIITPLCRTSVTLDEDLMLKGLMIIYDKNKNQ